MNQKQELVDLNINYLSMYDGVPVMETMYVNDTEYSQLSYLHNIMGVQEIIKVIRTRCPRTRYTFLDGDDLETYIADVQTIIKEYATNFKSISCEYMADEAYEQNNIFYAVLKVQFKNFIQEEYFKIIAIS
jgi:penicillin-binding protein-related factor A (putative recombinase)